MVLIFPIFYLQAGGKKQKTKVEFHHPDDQITFFQKIDEVLVFFRRILLLCAKRQVRICLSLPLCFDKNKLFGIFALSH